MVFIDVYWHSKGFNQMENLILIRLIYSGKLVLVYIYYIEDIFWWHVTG